MTRPVQRFPCSQTRAPLTKVFARHKLARAREAVLSRYYDTVTGDNMSANRLTRVSARAGLFVLGLECSQRWGVRKLGSSIRAYAVVLFCVVTAIVSSAQTF